MLLRVVLALIALSTIRFPAFSQAAASSLLGVVTAGSGAAEDVQTATSGNQGQLLEEKTIKYLPIVGARGRKPLQLLEIQPGISNFDASFAKHPKLTETYGLEIRANITHLANRPTFGFPAATLTSATFGSVRDTTLSSSRKIQLGARFY